jgi:hypothetical protein
MKTSFLTTRIFIAPLFLVMFHCYGAFAQTAAEADAPKDEKAAVLMAVSQLNQAMVDREKATLELITMEELSYGHSGGKIETKKAFIDDIVQGDFDFIATDTENQTVFFSGDDTAVVRHIFLIEAVNKGERVNIRIGNMMVFKKHQSQWKLLARQAYKL